MFDAQYSVQINKKIIFQYLYFGNDDFWHILFFSTTSTIVTILVHSKTKITSFDLHLFGLDLCAVIVPYFFPMKIRHLELGMLFFFKFFRP